MVPGRGPGAEPVWPGRSTIQKRGSGMGQKRGKGGRGRPEGGMATRCQLTTLHFNRLMANSLCKTLHCFAGSIAPVAGPGHDRPSHTSRTQRGGSRTPKQQPPYLPTFSRCFGHIQNRYLPSRTENGRLCAIGYGSGFSSHSYCTSENGYKRWP